MLKVAAFDPVIETTADYSLEVSLIAVKYLVPYIVLLQDLFWSSEDHPYGSLKGKYQVLRSGFGIRIPVDLAHLLAYYILVSVWLNI
jgi:hypothetical protein